jgi:hypothetical protein
MDLLRAWNTTGNPIYPQYFNDVVVDWVSHMPCNDAGGNRTQCVPIGREGTRFLPCTWTATGSNYSCATGAQSSPWRLLEAASRVSPLYWPDAFFGFQQAEEFSVSARCLMLLGVHEHNKVLAADGGIPGKGTPNWEVDQWKALTYSCLAFPQLNDCEKLLDLAFSELLYVMQRTVYPDGIETEMAAGYGTASTYQAAVDLLQQRGGRNPPEAFMAHLEAMWNYWAYVAKPNGCLPREGDTEGCDNGYSAEAAATFDRPDWTYVKTGGKSGQAPNLTVPSVMFPWGGHAVMRSGFDVNATWCWFDVGPYGSSDHAHRDKLSIALHAFGSMLLADDGVFEYSGDNLPSILHAQYAHSTHAHNTLTIDGHEQAKFPAVVTAPVLENSWAFDSQRDVVQGSMSNWDGVQGAVTHFRTVHYAKANTAMPYFVVVDAIEGDRQRHVQTVWHSHPNSSVHIDAASNEVTIEGVDPATGQGTDVRLRVIPAVWGSTPNWHMAKLVVGQKANANGTQQWQGWFSQAYGDAWPAPAVVYDADGVSERSLCAWLLVPYRSAPNFIATFRISAATNTTVVADVEINGHASQVTVPFIGGVRRAAAI